MEPEKKGIPYVRVVTQAVEAYEPKELLIYEDPDKSDEDNQAFIHHQLRTLWNELYAARLEGMNRPFIWTTHPHMYNFYAERVGYESHKDRVVFRCGINIGCMCNMIYAMEKWYIPLFYGEDIIDWLVDRWPVTCPKMGDMCLTRNSIAVTMPPMLSTIRRVWNTKRSNVNEDDLHSLCKDMMRDAFGPRYLTDALAEPVIMSFMKGLDRKWEGFEPLPMTLGRMKVYSSLLIAAMSITTDGNVDDMCAIELWDGLQTFVAENYPYEAISDLILVVQDFRRYSGTNSWNLVYDGGERYDRV